MAYSRFEQSEEIQREELIRKIEASVKSMSIRELEALYYELIKYCIFVNILTLLAVSYNQNYYV